jgi:hypothetical protein
MYFDKEVGQKWKLEAKEDATKSSLMPVGGDWQRTFPSISIDDKVWDKASDSIAEIDS